MPSRPVDIDDLPDPLPSLFLLVGDEGLLVDRAISAISAAARRADPSVAETRLAGSELEGSELHEMLGPSLFGEARLLVIEAAQDVRTAAATVLLPYLHTPADGTVIVLHHVGGAKGKAVLDAARKAKALEIGCAKLTRPDERADFVRAEVRRNGGRIGPDAVAALLDAVGSDLRELAAVSGQLVSDSGGEIGLDVVRAYHRGRAEVTGFAVSDLAVVGRSGPALEALRFALSVGVPLRGDRRRARRRHPLRCPGRVGGRGRPVRAGQEAGHAAVEGQARLEPGAGLERGGPAPGARRRCHPEC